MTYNISIDDYIGRWGFSKNWIRQEMEGYKNKPVSIRLSSMGGMVDDALDIRQQFIDHGNVSVYIFGYCASAATILATGAKKIYMSKYAFFLIHKVSNWVDAWGQMNADQMEQLIEELKQNKEDNEKMDIVLANLYAQKTGKTIDDILPIMKKGGWLNAQEAKDLGLVDEIIEEGEKVNIDKVNVKFNMLGIPALPTGEESKAIENHNEESAEDKAPSWFQNFIDRFFSHHKQNVESPLDNQEPKTETTMNKNYQTVNTLLNIEGIEFDAEGRCNLTEDQIKTINARIAALEQSNGEQQTTITDLTTQVENLKKADGAQTNHIEGDGERQNEMETLQQAEELFNNVKDII